ncbi:MAG: YIP1 family protein [Deltaproteobacteria bacterium]|nr:YIP1 family protein [Deltaproteobacteria bacterium]
MDLIERAKNIILRPSHEWEVIEGETVQIAELYKRYIIHLAAIGPVASLIFFSFVGVMIPYEGIYYVPLAFSITQAILSYTLILIGVYIAALVIDVTAPRFHAERNFIQAFKVSTYSFTPVWLAGIFHLIPGFSIISIIFSLYGFYLLYIGLPALMKNSPLKTVCYMVIVVPVVVFVLLFIALMRSALVSISR